MVDLTFFPSLHLLCAISQASLERCKDILEDCGHGKSELATGDCWDELRSYPRSKLLHHVFKKDTSNLRLIHVTFDITSALEHNPWPRHTFMSVLP